MNTQFDTFAYTNRLRSLPPIQKLAFAISSLLIALGSHPPVQIAIAVWLTIWIVVYAGIPLKLYGSMLFGVIFFLCTTLPVLVFAIIPIAMTQNILSDRVFGVDISNWHFYITQTGLIQAEQIFCRALASISCLFFITFTVPFIEISLLLEKMGCPSILTELLMLSYRFIFLLADVSHQITTAQTARGGYRTPKLAIASLGLLISQLLQRTIGRYAQLSLGVKARGFNHEFRFWQKSNYKFSFRFAVESALGCLGLIGWEVWYLVRT